MSSYIMTYYKLKYIYYLYNNLLNMFEIIILFIINYYFILFYFNYYIVIFVLNKVIL